VCMCVCVCLFGEEKDIHVLHRKYINDREKECSLPELVGLEVLGRAN
jgi:hypothetical protein